MDISALTSPLFEGDDPNKFWLVFDIDPDRLPNQIDELRQGIVPGLAGISSSREIVIHFFTIARNALFVMDGAAVQRINTIRSFPYGDAAAMLADGMNLSYRLFNKRPDTTTGTYGLMQNIAQYVFAVYDDPTVRYLLDYSAFYDRCGAIFSKATVRIDSVEDLAHFLYGCVHEHQLIRDSYRNDQLRAAVRLKGLMGAIYEAFRRIGRIYQSEAEWIVKGDVFRIPRGSSLIVAEPARLMAMLPNFRAGRLDGPSRFMHGDSLKRLDRLVRAVERLSSIYRIQFVDYHRFQAVRGRLFDRRKKS